jgi:LysM repeat protein
MVRGNFPRDGSGGDQPYDGDDDRLDNSSYTDAYGQDTGYETGYQPEYDTGYATGYHDGAGSYEPSDDDYSRSLIAAEDESARLPTVADNQAAPMIIPGSGVSMGNPFIKRRERPLTLRLAILTLTAFLVVTGLFAVSPLGTSASANLSSFQALSGSVLFNQGVSYHWYVAVAGDSVESIAAAQHVQVGGIYELNGLYAGQEITVGKAYKIPDDPFYGKDFRPKQLYATGAGKTVFGDSPWTSIAGDPLPEAPCAPNGNGNPSGYQLVSPNWHSNWVRGFSWYHNGVDIAANAGNPIRAAQAGEVIWAGWDFYGLGNSIKINNCNHISTVYGHMEQLLVKAGDFVQPGQIIGLEGSTGFSTGPHLHFMVEWDNTPVDPMQYFNYSICRITDYC